MDPSCSATGYYPNLPGERTNAKHLLSETCEQYKQANGFDQYESLQIIQGASRAPCFNKQRNCMLPHISRPGFE